MTSPFAVEKIIILDYPFTFSLRGSELTLKLLLTRLYRKNWQYFYRWSNNLIE